MKKYTITVMDNETGKPAEVNGKPIQADTDVLLIAWGEENGVRAVGLNQNAKVNLEAIPAADVVEVVRCRDCMFWDTSWNPGVGITGGAYYCPRCHLVTLKDSFCSGAYRKDGGQVDV